MRHVVKNSLARNRGRNGGKKKELSSHSERHGKTKKTLDLTRGGNSKEISWHIVQLFEIYYVLNNEPVSK